MVAGGQRHPYVARQAVRRRIAMTILRKSIVAALLATAAVIGGFPAQRVAALTPAGEFASHRAIYELKLAHTRGNSPAVAARGRILYHFFRNGFVRHAPPF